MVRTKITYVEESALMSELIQMRQRINAIETIKKITHAMRLISMSSHSHLKHKEAALHEYEKTLRTLFFTIQTTEPKWAHPILHPQTRNNGKQLIILVGSQKGLCGSFNNTLFHTFARHIDLTATKKVHIIAIGKKAIDFTKKHAPKSVIATHEELNIRTLFPIAHTVATSIFETTVPYTKIIVWSNVLKTFFLQKPEESILAPLEKQAVPKQNNSFEGYTWEFSTTEVLDALAQQYLEARMQHLLFQSLLAEHAARFISMDSSTRNAQTLLETTKIMYNKVRQAKITKELTELSGSF